MDLMQKYHEFAKIVAAALTAQGIVPPENGSHYAVMVIVHNPPEGKKRPELPVGGALNFIDNKWEVQAELAEATPLDDN